MMNTLWNYGALLTAATWFLMLPRLGELCVDIKDGDIRFNVHNDKQFYDH